MALTFVVGQGNFGTTSWTTDVTSGNVAQGDVIFLFNSNGGSTADPAVSDNSGDGNSWTKIGSSTLNGSGWWKRVSGGNWGSSTVTITSGSNTTACSGCILIYRGAQASGDPYTSANFESNASGDESATGLTPDFANSELVAVIYNYVTAVGDPTSMAFGGSAATSRASGNGDNRTDAYTLTQVGGPAASGNFTWSQGNSATVTLVLAIPPNQVPLTNAGGFGGGNQAWGQVPWGSIPTAAAGNQTVTPPTATLTTTSFAPVIKHQIIVPVKTLTTSLFAPIIKLGVIPPTVALTTTTFAPTVTATQNRLIVPPTVALTITAFAPVIQHKIIVPVKTLTLTTFVPVIKLAVIPPTAALSITSFAPIIKHQIIVPVKALTTSAFAPTIVVGKTVVPPTVALSLSTFAPILQHRIIVPVKALTTSLFAPTVAVGQYVVPPTKALILTSFAPQLRYTVIVPKISVSLSTFAPTISTPRLVIPTTGSLSTTSFAPTINMSQNIRCVPGTLSLVLTCFEPTISGASTVRTPSSGAARKADIKRLRDWWKMVYDDDEDFIILQS